MRNNKAQRAWNPAKQADFTVGFGALMMHLTTFRQNVQALTQHTSAENIAVTKATLKTALVMLDRLEDLAQSGELIL